MLAVVSQLATMFRKRFLSNLYSREEPEVLKAFYIVSQALVGLWMNPFNDVFDLESQQIPSAKKLLYYFIFFHRKSSIPWYLLGDFPNHEHS